MNREVQVHGKAESLFCFYFLKEEDAVKSLDLIASIYLWKTI